MRKFFLFAILILFQNSLQSQLYTDTLKVAYTSAPPFIIVNEESLEGINIWLWEQIATDLDIPFELKPMNFSEMLQALNDGTIDVSINPLTITSERSKKMDFTHSYYASNSTVVVYEASSLQQLLQFFRSFFNVNFIKGFCALLFIIILFGLAIWMFENRKNPDQFRPGWKGVWDGLWWSVVTMTTVGYGDKTPKSRAGKIIALVWMFSGLLFISGLTASVASMLTIDQLKTNPEGFNEYKEHPIGCIKNSSTYEFLEERFFKNIVEYENVISGLNDLNKKKIEAFLYDEPILRYRLKKDDSFHHLRLLPLKFDLQFYAFGIRKNRPELEQQISHKILEITESLEWRVILNEYNLTEI
ncbi:MAG: transporter substrate-binding domain-containing protein [Bacteroidota bacterium]